MRHENQPLELVCFFSIGNWEKLTHCAQPKGPLICDIYTGAGYQGPPCKEHIGAFFNTDGIQPFKSSRLTNWPIFIALASLPPSIRMNRDNLVTLALWVTKQNSGQWNQRKICIDEGGRSCEWYSSRLYALCIGRCDKAIT